MNDVERWSKRIKLIQPELKKLGVVISITENDFVFQRMGIVGVRDTIGYSCVLEFRGNKVIFKGCCLLVANGDEINEFQLVNKVIFKSLENNFRSIKFGVGSKFIKTNGTWNEQFLTRISKVGPAEMFNIEGFGNHPEMFPIQLKWR